MEKKSLYKKNTRGADKLRRCGRMEAKDSRNKRKNDLGMARRGISSMSDVEEEIDETIPV